MQASNMVDIPGLSYGLFHAVVAPMKTFGVVMSVTFPGVMMDIGHLRHLRVAKDNDTQSWIDYNRKRGQQQSFLEAAVPEQFFTNLSTAIKPDGISAAKAIAFAAAQGQKIFTITPTNAAAALPQLQHSASVMAEINNALNAGKEVTISEKPVTMTGWTGAGYEIVDPTTGAGGYLIEGGANGAFLFAIAFAVLAMFLTATVGPAWLIVIQLYGFYNFLEKAANTVDDKILTTSAAYSLGNAITIIGAAMGISLAMDTLEKLAVTHPLMLGSTYVAMFSYFFK